MGVPFLSTSAPKPPTVAEQADYGIQSDIQTQPDLYKLQSAMALGQKVTLSNGQTYDFTGKGNADITGGVSDKMAATLLQLMKEKDPTLIQQRLNELKAADPQGYAARQQLFDKIQENAKLNPNSPVSADLQQQLQDELSKGAGFSDPKQQEQVREGVRGQQYASGITLGNAPTSQEAKAVVNAGESLQSQRQANALKILEAGTSPEDVAYQNYRRAIGNEGAFANGTNPTSQFADLSAPGMQQPVAGGPTAGFNSNAAGSGAANSIYNSSYNWANSQTNPWLAGIGTAAQGVGAAQSNGWFGLGQNQNQQPGNTWVNNGQRGG